MMSRLDLVLISACLASGAMAVENYQRTDLAATDGAGVKPAPTMVCTPPHSSAVEFALKHPFEAEIGDIVIVCTPG